MARRRKNQAGPLQAILDFIIRNLYIVVIAAVLFFIVKYIHNMLLDSEYFIVKNIDMIRVNENNRVTGPKTVLTLKKNTNIFNLDIKKCQKDIEAAYPEIKNVRVHRNLPDKLIAVYQKRIPFCQAKSARYYLVSKEAVVLPAPSSTPYQDLPVVVGVYISESHLPKNRKINSAPIQRAIQLIEQIKQTDFEKRYKIKEIDVYDEFNPIVLLESGIQLKIGRRNFKEIKNKLEEVLRDLEEKGLGPKAIDLRFDDIVVIPK